MKAGKEYEGRHCIPIYGNVISTDYCSDETFGLSPTKAKMALRAKEFPYSDTGRFVNHFVCKQEDVFSHLIEDGSLMIGVPSSSGNNQLTDYFGGMLEDFGGTFCDDFGDCVHSSEAKRGKYLYERNKIKIRYCFKEADSLVRKCLEHKKIFVVDDILNTGESAIVLAKQLNQLGITVDGILGLIPFSINYPSNKELSDYLQILISKVGLKLSEQEDLKPKIKVVFGEFLKHKINRETALLRHHQIDARNLCYESILDAFVFNRQLMKDTLDRKMVCGDRMPPEKIT